MLPLPAFVNAEGHDGQRCQDNHEQIQRGQDCHGLGRAIGAMEQFFFILNELFDVFTNFGVKEPASPGHSSYLVYSL